MWGSMDRRETERLLETEGYEPTAAGMSAARPYITTFASVHDQDGLARLSRRVRLRA